MLAFSVESLIIMSVVIGWCYMNALQVNDALLEGFQNGFELAVDTFRVRMHELGESRADMKASERWRICAAGLETQVQEMRLQIARMASEHARELREYETSVNGYGIYSNRLAKELEKTTREVRTRSAGEHAFRKLAELLTIELGKSVQNHSECALLNPNMQNKIIQDAYEVQLKLEP
jgi:hypothetical protein